MPGRARGCEIRVIILSINGRQGRGPVEMQIKGLESNQIWTWLHRRSAIHTIHHIITALSAHPRERMRDPACVEGLLAFNVSRIRMDFARPVTLAWHTASSTEPPEPPWTAWCGHET
eukprot:6306927-Prymnesium_polylepis.1